MKQTTVNEKKNVNIKKDSWEEKKRKKRKLLTESESRESTGWKWHQLNENMNSKNCESKEIVKK